MHRLSFAAVAAALAVVTLGAGCTSPGAPPPRLHIRRRDRLGGLLHEYEHAA